MPSPITHEYHYPGGPVTLEYQIGSAIPEAHASRLSPFVHEVATSAPEATKSRLATKWARLSPAVKPIAAHLLEMDVCSVIFTGSNEGTSPSWVVFRSESGAQWMLGEPAPETAEELNCNWIDEVSGLRSLVTEFGALQVGMIPPCTGFHVGRVVRESDKDLCWGPTGKWEGALPIYHDGSGCSVCVNPVGEVGIWSPGQFQDISPSFVEFVNMFVERQVTGESPQSQWWW